MWNMFFTFSVIFALAVLAVFLLCIPIIIANARCIYGGEKTTIVVLSLLGVFFGITWFIALILSLVWRGDCITGGNGLEQLERISRLYKDKVISKEEYEKMKAKILK